jgi:methyltransferase (TIGR00027 family)
MPVSSPSRTALGVAILRAAHQVLDAPPLILTDAIARRLLDPSVQDWVASAPDELQSPQARGLRGHVVVRSRFAEDRLAAAVRRGVRQYVLLGAGYDTFAYRQPDWARDCRIFEVDLPGTQEDKRARLAAADIAPPPNLTFVAIDFAHDDLGARLAEAGLDAAQPSLFAWLGVTMYLEADANDAVFRHVAAQPRGSELVFTFAQTETETAGGPSRLAELAAQAGEPWKTRYDPASLAAHLAAVGYSSVWMPTPAEVATAYFLDRPDDLPLPRRRTLAAAVV